MPKILVLCGLPASGKSYFRSAFKISNPDYVSISSDDIIDSIALSEGKSYSEVFMHAVKIADRQCRDEFANAIADKRDIILDRTNMSIKGRSTFLSKVPSDYEKIAIIFEVDPELLQFRLAERALNTGKHIPNHVVSSMRASYQAPTVGSEFMQVFSSGDSFLASL